ncbi:MAG: hypothetical protein J6X62_03875 [Bacteroidales bacterium]|nr:hypothetical protein [Bacteroidales bacterium]
MKSKYITPEITVVEFKVEAGFAASGDAPQGSLGLRGGNFVESQNSGDGGYEATSFGGSQTYDDLF